MKRIGLFGGSFDPVHNAHVALATLAAGQLALDEVRWIPVCKSSQKARKLAPAADREAMVRELALAEPDASWVLILGQDQYAGLHTWRDWRELVSRVTLAIANRPDVVASTNPQVANVAHQIVQLPMMDVSSTEIRRRVAAGESIAGLVPVAVASYIERHRLYR
jgi:nicotinate-nucleotide adenylyltransferase